MRPLVRDAKQCDFGVSRYVVYMSEAFGGSDKGGRTSRRLLLPMHGNDSNDNAIDWRLEEASTASTDLE